MVESAEEPEIDEEIESGDVVPNAVLSESRHLEEIRQYEVEAHCWRLKDRMKTVSVALVLCLNIPVDPPDVVKLHPCARLESWIDPHSLPPSKAIEAIGASLQKAYERWQPKARYKCSADPTVDDIKRLCTSLRRNAKEERVLFHYNGHGVPRPTDNGEVWVFNSNYTQYIPLSIYDLQQWMGTPSIYVYDCSHAGKIVKLFKSFLKHQEDGRCIQLAACSETELLPMSPDLPADVFTACLTTPVKMAIRFYLMQNKNRALPAVTPDMLEKIPGLLNDRRSMMGELNWIFTAITDTIAWNTLPRDLFQKLFRQDLLVASLFRNFLLAQRILRAYDCTPVSCPALPQTYQNSMWNTWDLSLELSLAQLPSLLSLGEPGAGYISSPFFEQQLTAFQVWLDQGSVNRPPPEQLPIVLQVLLSQVYRPRALELLGSFLGHGPWAVNLVLEVGIFPYILKLLQSTSRELRPLLTLLWAKILAVDPQCKADLVRESGNKYFTSVLGDVALPCEHRTMAAFIMCCLVSECPEGQMTAFKGNILPNCLELVQEEDASLRQWATICASRTWYHLPEARWVATRDNAPEKLGNLLDDKVPEVRTAAVYALGTFLQSLPPGDKSEQVRAINHNIAVSLKRKLAEEASPLVRYELVVSLHYLVLTYESSFKEIAKQFYLSDNSDFCQSLLLQDQSSRNVSSNLMSPSPSLSRLSQRNLNKSCNVSCSPNMSESSISDQSSGSSPFGVRRAGSAQSLSSMVNSPSLFGCGTSISFGRMYHEVWQALITLQSDPCPMVSAAAAKVIIHIKQKIVHPYSDASDYTAVKAMRTSFTLGESPPKSLNHIRRNSNQNPVLQTSELLDEFIKPLIKTQYVEWSTNLFIKTKESRNKNSSRKGPTDEKENQPPMSHLPKGSAIGQRRFIGSRKVDEQVFLQKISSTPNILLFHPNEPNLAIATNRKIIVYDLESASQITAFNNFTSSIGSGKISSMQILNPKINKGFLCVGSDDGAVRVWRDIFGAEGHESKKGDVNIKDHSKLLNKDIKPPCLVTAFQGLEKNRNSSVGNGMLLSWEQETTTLICGGVADHLCLWDLHAESRQRDILSEGLCTTSLHSSSDGPFIACGFADGHIRLFDRRISIPLVRQWRDSPSSIVHVQLFNSSSTAAHIISGAESGEVRLCDLRRAGSVQVCQPSIKMSSMAYNQHAHLFAVGSDSQQISLYHTSGSSVNIIKFYDGFVGHRMGPVTCVDFHPSHHVLLASGTTDDFVAIHGLSNR